MQDSHLSKNTNKLLKWLILTSPNRPKLENKQMIILNNSTTNNIFY